jgi:hypothetical protein
VTPNHRCRTIHPGGGFGGALVRLISVNSVRSTHICGRSIGATEPNSRIMPVWVEDDQIVED